MPLALVGRPKDAVVVVPTASDWRRAVARFLADLGADGDRIDRHLRLLGERAAGQRDWRQVYAGRTLPGGRPMPPSRAYAESLVHEDALPLYDAGGFPVSVDLHNPGNEAGVAGYDPSWLEIAIVADVGAFSAIAPGSVFDAASGFEAVAARRAEHGRRLGELVAALVEVADADFAYADIGSTGWVVGAATDAASVVHPAPSSVGPWDFLWSITVWGPRRLTAELAARIDRLELDDAIRSKLDPYARPHVRLERRSLATGARLLQYRFLLGSEARGERAALDTPLAKRLGLRSTNLLFRA